MLHECSPKKKPLKFKRHLTNDFTDIGFGNNLAKFARSVNNISAQVERTDTDEFSITKSKIRKFRSESMKKNSLLGRMSSLPTHDYRINMTDFREEIIAGIEENKPKRKKRRMKSVARFKSLASNNPNVTISKSMHNGSNNIEKVSTVALRDYMRKSDCRMQSLIQLTPTLKRKETKKKMPVDFLNQLKDIKTEKTKLGDSQNDRFTLSIPVTKQSYFI